MVDDDRRCHCWCKQGTSLSDRRSFSLLIEHWEARSRKQYVQCMRIISFNIRYMYSELQFYTHTHTTLSISKLITLHDWNTLKFAKTCKENMEGCEDNAVNPHLLWRSAGCPPWRSDARVCLCPFDIRVIERIASGYHAGAPSPSWFLIQKWHNDSHMQHLSIFLQQTTHRKWIVHEQLLLFPQCSWWCQTCFYFFKSMLYFFLNQLTSPPLPTQTLPSHSVADYLEVPKGRRVNHPPGA